jgi:tRNA nucleotidyltransferase/poly(A) polymerase
MSEETIPTSSKPKSSREDALTVLKRLRDNGHVAYFAGGCVRDMLLGIEPKDYDVATDAPPEKVRRLFSNTQAVGAAFGVILVRLGGSQIEVATFRADLDYKDGRHPEGVRFTTAEEDAKRRDFTINGLFFDPIENKVIDYVGGQEDLKNKILRAIGEPNHRFEEDHLRMLRAARFAARFRLNVEDATASAINLHREHLKRISPERIAGELRLMLTPSTRESAWQILSYFKLDEVIFRHLPERGARANSNALCFHDVAPGEPISFGLALAAATFSYRAGRRDDFSRLFEHDEVVKTVNACRTGLKISNEESDLLAGCLELSAFLADEPPSVATMKRFLAEPFADDARRMLRGLGKCIALYAPRVEWLEREFDRLSREDVAPPPFVTGDDLVAQGLRPGRLFKRVLDAVYDAQLEDRVKTKDEAMRLAMEIANA